MPGKNFSRRHFETCFPPLFFLQKNRLWISCKGPIFYTHFGAICMKGQSLFSGKNKKKNIIKLSSSEFSQRVVMVKYDPLQSPKNCSLCGQRNLRHLRPPLILIKVHAIYSGTYACYLHGWINLLCYILQCMYHAMLLKGRKSEMVGAVA